MSTATGKSTWAASDEPLLNVPQSERSDDVGEHSEVLSSDVQGPAATNTEETELHPSKRKGPASTATPEAPLVSPDGDAPRPS
jgi:hypothetical protein